jgi:hypothetical protein
MKAQLVSRIGQHGFVARPLRDDFESPHAT